MAKKMQLKIYRIESGALQNVKKILDAEERMEQQPDGSQKWKTNEFARVGYTLRDAKTLGIEENCAFLYIKAEDDFFAKNEKAILLEGVKKTEGAEFEKVREKIEAEKGGAEAGVGAVFAGF